MGVGNQYMTQFPRRPSDFRNPCQDKLFITRHPGIHKRQIISGEKVAIRSPRADKINIIGYLLHTSIPSISRRITFRPACSAVPVSGRKRRSF
jgi:hypothetical protein